MTTSKCTCPWWQEPVYRRDMGHHIDCPALQGAHSPEDGCGEKGHVDG